MTSLVVYAGMSLEEFPINLTSKSARETDESGCDEVVSSAIAEVSKDFTTGNLSTGPLASGESDDSHLSSDNDFKHRRGAAYARYPESAAGLSDNDWNPYVTESDTNTSPRLPGELRPSLLTSGTDSKVNSLVLSFNPPLCSTKSGSASRISKTSLPLTDPRPAPENSLHLSDIRETSELSLRSIGSLKPDASISPPQMTSSKLSEYSFGKRSYEAHDDSNASHSQSREEAARSLRRCFERTSWPPSPDKALGSGRANPGFQTRAFGEFGRSDHKAVSGFDYTRLEESFKKLGNFGDRTDQSSWEIKNSLPGRGYFSDAVQSALSGHPAVSNQRNMPATDLKTELDGQKSRISTMAIASASSKSFAVSKGSVGEQSETYVTLSEDLSASEKSGMTRVSGDSDARTSMTSSSTETVIPATTQSGKEPVSSEFKPQTILPAMTPSWREPASSTSKHQDRLSQQVDRLLQETAYLTSSSRAKERAKERKAADTTTSLDYDRLHRDLQEIQDSLHTMGQPPVNSPHPNTVTASSAGIKSDSDDADIVPSTTTTPERGRRLMWDYGADLGYGQGDMNHLEGMMSDATTESSPLDSHHPNSDKLHYTSDGEETRTSSMEHGEEEEHHEDTNMMLTNQLGQAAATAGNGMDLEELISTFRNETRALENRYQAVRSQVCRKSSSCFFLCIFIVLFVAFFCCCLFCFHFDFDKVISVVFDYLFYFLEFHL